jgi:hypothetical protein
MSMYDELRCSYPLPVPGWDGVLFQTKSTPAQWMDLYEIRADGSLWHQDYDLEDKSDPKAEGISRWLGCMTRVNARWEPIPDFTGEIVFHELRQGEWIEFSAYFAKGKIAMPIQLRNHEPKPQEPARAAVQEGLL